MLLPQLEAAYQEYQDRGMILLAISVQEGRDRVAEFVQEQGFTFPVLLDGEGKVALNYLVFKHPETFFIDQEGIIRQRTIGPMTKRVILSKYERTKGTASSAKGG